MPTNDDIAGDAGFTLIELLVAMTISTIVLLATLMSFDAFSSNSTEQSRTADANGQVRAAMDQTVNDLRGAATITRAAADDLVYAVQASPTETRTRRICRSTVAGDGAVYQSQTTGATAAAMTCTPSGPTGWTVSRLATKSSSNSSTSAMFSYDGASTSSTPATIKTVGLAFALDTTNGGRATSSALRASVSIRKVAGATTALSSIKPDDFDVYCPSTGPKLNLSANALGLLGPLQIVYANTGGITLPNGILVGGQEFAVPTGVTTVLVKITDALGVTKTITKPIGCVP